MTVNKYAARLDRRYGALTLLSGFVAVWALAGAFGLLTGGIDLGTTIVERLPFDSTVFAGLALLFVVGVPMTATTVMAYRADPRATALAIVSGGLLVGWIVVQLSIIRTFSWMQPVSVAFGLTVLVVGVLIGPRRDGSARTA